MSPCVRRLTSLLSVLCIASLALAQPPGGRMSVDDRVAALKTRLTLTKDQEMKVRDILTVSQSEVMKAREKSAGDREAMRKSARDIMEKNDRQIEALLNDTQKKEFAKLREEQRQQMRERQEQREKETK